MNLNRMQVSEFMADGEKRDLLMLALAVIIDLGKRFVESTYTLEGDAFLSVRVYSFIADLCSFIEDVRAALNFGGDEIFGYFPNVRGLFDRFIGHNSFSVYKAHVKSVVRPMIRYFRERFVEVPHGADRNADIFNSIELFKVIRIFDPEKVVDLNPHAEDIRRLCQFKPFSKLGIFNALVQELPAYRRIAAEHKLAENEDKDILQWFCHHKDELKTFFEAAKCAALIQPSSAAAERVFSLLKRLQDHSQTSMLKDYQETSAMLKYNDNKRDGDGDSSEDDGDVVEVVDDVVAAAVVAAAAGPVVPADDATVV
eukprot:TRINITY_DN16952_c0_g1_i1.p1 TRINITY_DN16952_c0_g1~~TRINITY_DN16952_c0_g1_i1.p1  ORF type:complete len:312 (-),score=93.90 TRINITY_DN16952_c0_g1_i1:114-1049(-)